jgi:amino-acid N-acetyltransferase
MAEIGIDISGNFPKSITQFLDQPFDFVITVCDDANETCPVFTGNVGRRVHISFEDPAKVVGTPGEVLGAFRRIRDEIKVRLREFHDREIWGLRPAASGDLQAVSALLTESQLPLDGLNEQFGSGYVVAVSEAAVVGMAGLEVHGEDGLLRSVAVSPRHRQCGLGAVMVRNRIEWARTSGLPNVYLLTTTAASYFPRFGFSVVGRDGLPDSIRQSREFAEACPATAVAMRLTLNTY